MHDATLPDTPELDEPAESDPLHKASECWASWIRTRRFYAAPSLPPSVLGKLRTGTWCPLDGANAVVSAEMSALNEAIEAQPLDALDRQVFEMHYRHRVKPIKVFASALGISRQHWYTLLRAFERRVHAGALQIEARNQAARAELGRPERRRQP